MVGCAADRKGYFMFNRLLLAVILAVPLALAQEEGGGMGGGGMGGGGGRGGGAGGDGLNVPTIRPQQRQSPLEQFGEKLKLSKEQREQTSTILNAAFEESMSLRTELDKGRVSIASAMISGKGGDELKKMLDQYAVLESQMTAIEAKAFAKILATLKPNQLSHAGQSFELLGQVFERPQRQPGGGGRRGR